MEYESEENIRYQENESTTRVTQEGETSRNESSPSNKERIRKTNIGTVKDLKKEEEKLKTSKIKDSIKVIKFNKIPQNFEKVNPTNNVMS